MSTTLDDAIRGFLAFRRLRNLSPHTIARYTTDFRRWTSWRTARGCSERLVDVTIEELRAFFLYLRDEHVIHSTNPHRPTLDRIGLAPETIRNIWKLLHAAWVFWIEEDLLTERQIVFFARGRIPVPKVPQQIRPTYAPAAIEALLAADGQKQQQDTMARDKALILLLYESGMRVSELCGICDEDVTHSERQAIVTGKGNKQRYVFWTERAAQALEAYLELRPGTSGGPLFRAHGRGGRGGRSFGKALSPDLVRAMLVRRAERAETTLPASAVHALRHTFAHRFLDQGGDGLYLQQILGHESIVTTMRYVRENPGGLRKMYRRVMTE